MLKESLIQTPMHYTALCENTRSNWILKQRRDDQELHIQVPALR